MYSTEPKKLPICNRELRFHKPLQSRTYFSCGSFIYPSCYPVINKCEQEHGCFVFIYKLFSNFLSKLFDKQHARTANRFDKSVVFNKDI